MLSRRQIKAADRVPGIELMLPWPAALPPPDLALDEERDATPRERAAAEAALGDLERHGLVLTEVLAVVAHGHDEPNRPVAPYLACIIRGRRWLKAHPRPDPVIVWADRGPT